jgi:hypothetical protein
MVMLEDFSSGYYRSEMRVQEYDDGPVIEQQVYDFINRNIYMDSSVPVMMRLGLDAGERFKVKAESAVPKDVLALPKELFDTQGMQSIFVLKPDHVETVGQYYG